MTEARLTELEILANSHPGNRSSGYMLELIEAVRELQTKATKKQATTRRRAGFNPPTPAEVEAEFLRLGMNGEAKILTAKFMAHYESQGWIVGKVKMQSWKAACRTWKLNRKATSPATAAPTAPNIRRTAEPRL